MSLEKKFKNNDSQFFGSITDGDYKLDVFVMNFNDSNKCDRGKKVEIIGDLQESGN